MGFGERIGAAFRAFFSLLSSGTVPADVLGASRGTSVSEGAAAPAAAANAPPLASAPVPQVSAADGAVQILALLQRDARLLDFLMEDLAGYPDAQVGAAAREVQAGARRALLQYLDVEPVLDGTEDQIVTLPSVDADQVKIVGRSVATAPVRGTLRHRGWRSARVQLPALPPASARQVIAQAEVEVA